MKSTIAIAALLALSCAAVAQDKPLPDLPPARSAFVPSHVGLHLGSFHFDKLSNDPGSRGFNNATYGAYLRWDSGFTAGYFKNSMYADSFYAGWTWADKNDTFAVTAALASGYDIMKADSRNGAIPAGLDQKVRCDSIGCRTVGTKDVLKFIVVPSVGVKLEDGYSLRLGALLAVDKRERGVTFMLDKKF